MKKISKVSIAAILIALSASAYAGFGDFLSSATKALDTATTASDNLTTEKNELAKKLATSCASFADAKAKAYEAIGNKAEASNMETISKTLKSETNLTNLAKYLDGEKSASALSVVKDVKIEGTDAKAKILESVKSFAVGVQEEVSLSKELYDLAASAKERMANASVTEKVTLASELSGLVNLAKRFPADLNNAKDTLKGYMEFAKQNGIDVSSIASNLVK